MRAFTHGAARCGRWLVCAVLVVGACTARPGACTARPGPPELTPPPPDSEVVYPSRVDSRGHFLSHFLSPGAARVQRRSAATLLDTQGEGSVAALQDSQENVFYLLQHRGLSLTFNLTLNSLFLSPGALSERRRGGMGGATLTTPTSTRCHFQGEVRGQGVRGRAAVSVCRGLMGMFKVSGEEFFIEPLQQHQKNSAQPHTVYRRNTDSAPLADRAPDTKDPNATSGTESQGCGSRESAERSERHRQRWEQRQRRTRRLKQRSVSRERWVETLVVADQKMVEFHGRDEVENYVLAIMNIVSGLYSDASIGNSINIVVVRIILLEQDEEELKISHHADHSLNSFCRWQKSLNMKGDDHPQHHDVALLLTRKDICASLNSPCETLGLSHVSGMCQPHRSCSISEDTGLPLAFTVAHELGHNFGMQHDGSGNDCEPVGKRPLVMSPQLLYGTALPKWSECSREYLTRFLDRGWGWCLDDPPVQHTLSTGDTPLLPGLLYSAPHQCRLQYGPSSALCQGMEDVCSTLWCLVGQSCHSKLDGAVDGTSCGPEKWCVSGKCVPKGQFPQKVDGSWSSWSRWSVCTRTCGSGVQSAQRDCSNPRPAHRGRYCLGERRRYRLCNSTPCPVEKPTFRDLQCSQFNQLTYRGQQHEWQAVINRVNPCELHCRPLKQNFSEKMRDAVSDGTPCYEESKRRDLCINGICKRVGCDLIIDSSTVEDLCGVCGGNGSTCSTVRKTFNQTQGLGYVDVGLIPEGAWQIRIEEVAEAGNFLALRSDRYAKYFLNGGWTIQWDGEYPAAGALFRYQRTGQLELLTSPGPTKEPLWIQLLFQESNPGIRYEFTINQNYSEHNSSEHAGRGTGNFYWKHGSWSECSATCGTGVQTQSVHCVQRSRGIMEEQLCDPESRPQTKTRTCERETCPPRWWVGPWQTCSSTCGPLGLSVRVVLCVQAVSLEEQKALQDTDCEHIPRPESKSGCNTNIPCPSDWSAGNWSQCSVSCGLGSRWRNVHCSRNTVLDCDPLKKPPTTISCQQTDCPRPNDNFDTFDWSGSGSSSNEITSVLNEINPRPMDKPAPKFTTTKSQPRTTQDLNNLLEGDFHYHNNLENTEKRIHIDDFYYDYNFIDFHEDLSNDFEEDEKFSGNEDAPTSAPSTFKSTTFTTSHASGHKLPKHTDKDTKSMTTTSPSVEMSSVLEDFINETSTLSVSTTHSTPLSSTKPSNDQTKGSIFTTGIPDYEDEGNEEGIPDLTNAPTSAPPTFKPSHVSSYFPTKHKEEDTAKIHNSATTKNPLGKTPGIVEDFLAEDFLLPVSTTHSPLKPSQSRQDDQIETSSDRYESEAGDESDYKDNNKKDGRIVINNPSLSLSTAEERTSASPYTTAATLLPKTISLENSVSPTTNYYDDQTKGSSQYLEENKSDVFDYEDIGRIDPQITTTPTANNEGLNTLQGIFRDSQAPTLITPQQNPSTTVSLEISDFVNAMTNSYEGISYPSQMETGTRQPQGTEEPPNAPPTEQHSFMTGSPGTISEDVFDSSEHFYVSTTRGNVFSEVSRSYLETSTEEPLLKESTTLAMTVFSSVSNSLQTNAYWVAGNWSMCSTSCGLGAVWRPLSCSTGSESDCDLMKRPHPAQRCYLRPCSVWKTGPWSKCSRNCGGEGSKVREVQCLNLRDNRALRPFHCRTSSPPPPSTSSCGHQPCLDWDTSSWGQCSEVCGGGEQQRIVSCPEEDHCDPERRPEQIQRCNTQACSQWLSGSWGPCSSSCGTGLQFRLIKCFNTKEETEAEPSECSHEAPPPGSRKCQTQECSSAPPGSVCVRDRLTSRFCQTLRWLGRCSLSNVRSQCCRTCAARTTPIPKTRATTASQPRATLTSATTTGHQGAEFR